jgi:hypothetical protein
MPQYERHCVTQLHRNKEFKSSSMEIKTSPPVPTVLAVPTMDKVKCPRKANKKIIEIPKSNPIDINRTSRIILSFE